MSEEIQNIVIDTQYPQVEIVKIPIVEPINEEILISKIEQVENIETPIIEQETPKEAVIEPIIEQPIEEKIQVEEVFDIKEKTKTEYIEEEEIEDLDDNDNYEEYIVDESAEIASLLAGYNNFQIKKWNGTYSYIKLDPPKAFFHKILSCIAGLFYKKPKE
jgi:hypothetical protein